MKQTPENSLSLAKRPSKRSNVRSMAKNKRNSATLPPNAPQAGSSSDGSGDSDHFAVTREFVESLVVAVILALLFRAFEAEAFVIPTGSMATTLLGRHKDVLDEYTGYEYTVGSSGELDRDTQRQFSNVVEAIDPLYHRQTDISANPSYSGDRILVSKFAYDFTDPRRWDVIVFKYPEDPHINYIKRLIGLPGETVRIYHGDIYIKRPGDAEFQIARKPPAKQLTLQRLVYDTNYPCEILEEAGFPARLEAYPSETEPQWTRVEEEGYVCRPQGKPTWLRYRHVLPDNARNSRYWAMAETGQQINTEEAREQCSQLITDFTAYNSYGLSHRNHFRNSSGLHWVGDLAVECDAEITSEAGVLSLDLVEGGTHFRCDIDVATGQATLSADSETIVFDLEGPITAQTPVEGAGTYAFRFSNVDDELRLWVDGRLIDFGAPVTYQPQEPVQPAWSEEDPGDLLPAGIGTDSVEMTVRRVRVLRDTYYIADGKQYSRGRTSNTLLDYRVEGHLGWNDPSDNDIFEVMGSPEQWNNTQLFAMRSEAIFELGEGQYFPLGDNSAESMDGRLWEIEQQFVPRHLLIGKALFVYWPHSKNKPFPYFPNFSRMKFIQ